MRLFCASKLFDGESQGNARGGARCVNHHVGDGRVASWNEALVKFIGRSVKRAEKNGAGGGHSRSVLRGGKLGPEGSQGEVSEPGVFGQVAGFADAGVDKIEALVADSKAKPAEKDAQ